MLNGHINKTIKIKLRNKSVIQGDLQDFDQMMNLVLTNSKDMSGNTVKNLDKILLRGDNIIAVFLPDTTKS